MRSYGVRIDIYEYWHAGTGAGRGPVVDARAARDAHGLPYLPGKTVRGLLREGFQAAEESAHLAVPPGLTHHRFGGPEEEGCLRLTDALLPEPMRDWVRASEEGAEAASHLFARISSTAVSRETGQAEHHTLRTLEVAVPVTLHFVVYDMAEAPLGEEALRAAFGFVRGLGSWRRRGLGRAGFSLDGTEDERCG